ncbi:hypothetical protein RB597_007235 [Gaeumannomyces tritici]
MPLQLPGPTTPLHLYRHLLREVGYLPPVIQPCLVDRIKLMFRRHRKDQNPGARLRKAENKLRTVRAAVSGDTDRLLHLMGIAFGRRGFRRRQLLSEFLQLKAQDGEPPEDGAAFDALIRDRHTQAPTSSHSPEQNSGGKRYGALPAPDWLDKWDTEKLLRLLRYQAHAPGTTRKAISGGNLDPRSKVPEKNIWGRPFPAKLARTKMKKWWVHMAERALPPLPAAEWELLQALATGTLESGRSIIPRRPVAQTSAAESEIRRLAAQAWDMEAYLLKPTMWVDRKSSRKQVLLSGIPQQNDEFGHADGTRTVSHGQGGRAISTRAMKRLYLQVWQESPLMETDPKSPDKWTLRYGKPPAKTQVSASHALIFQGVDQKGIPTKPA